VVLETQLEKEYKNTGGWLQKQKLNDLAGETARQKQENQLKKLSKKTNSNANLLESSPISKIN